MSREFEDRREVVHVVQQSGRVVVTRAEDEAVASDAAATASASKWPPSDLEVASKSRTAAAANSLSSILGPRATRISVTSYEDDNVAEGGGSAIFREPGSNFPGTHSAGGIEKLCMIVDRFECDARRISRGSMLLPGEEEEVPASYRVVQLNFTPETEVFYMLFDRFLTISSMTSLKQHIEYFHFRCTIQFDLPVQKSPTEKGFAPTDEVAEAVAGRGLGEARASLGTAVPQRSHAPQSVKVKVVLGRGGIRVFCETVKPDFQVLIPDFPQEIWIFRFCMIDFSPKTRFDLVFGAF